MFASNIEAYETTLSIDDPNPASGAKLISDRKTPGLQGVTFCIRFFLELLSPRTTLMTIGDFQATNPQNAFFFTK